MLAHKNCCMVWSAKQCISIKDICNQKLTQHRHVTTISDQKCTVVPGNVQGGVSMGRCG